MQIARTCTIELSRDEVAEALTKYIHEKHRYSTDEIRPWQEVLAWGCNDPLTFGGIVLTWGEKPEPKTEAGEPPPFGASEAETPLKSA